MNQGVLLWKTGKLDEAVDWMRKRARETAEQPAHPVQRGAGAGVAHARARL
jgi:hypothetical protein